MRLESKLETPYIVSYKRKAEQQLRALPLHVKLKQQHIAVFHDVFLAFHAV